MAGAIEGRRVARAPHLAAGPCNDVKKQCYVIQEDAKRCKLDANWNEDKLVVN